MNKFIKWVCIVCAAIIVLGLGSIGVGTLLGGKVFGYAFNFGSKEIYTSKNIVEDTVQINPFSELYLESDASNIIIKLGNENKVSYRTVEELVPEITENDDRLSIISKRKTTFDFNMGFNNNQYIEIEVNEAGLKNLNVIVASGDVSIEDLDIEGMIKSSSGDIAIVNCKEGKDIELKNSSGSITLTDANFENITHKQSSGDTEFERVEAKTVIMGQSSGSTEIYSLKADSLESRVTSGSCKISNSEVPDLSIHVTSGQINGKFIVSDNIYLHATSGDVNFEIEGKENDYNYAIKATSGDIKIADTKIEKKYEKDNGSDNTITVDATSGDIVIGFVDAE